MLNKNDFQIGINLGGWISQYPVYDHNHFKGFINASDIKRIADWGFDHVRLPVDYPVLEDDNQPGVLKTSGLDYIHNCLEWCRQNNLRAILDLHKAPGFAFDEHEQATLFDNPALQERFINLWRLIAREFAGKMDDSLAFELLNEISLPDSSPWNVLVKKTIAEIRKIDPQRLITVGGNYYNSVDDLQNLDILADDNILYTFHFYLPIALTHQKAPWLAPIYEYNHTLDYPGQKADGLEEIFKKYPWFHLADEIGVSFDKNYLRSKLQPAIEFMQKTGQPLYCGEFGVYEIAPMTARLNWSRDVVDLLNEFHIGRAIWTYKALDFGLVDKNGKVVSEELVKIASRR
jgi:aryl-phospho-beta-D-glucosidase BglC (GH1 family)